MYISIKAVRSVTIKHPDTEPIYQLYSVHYDDSLTYICSCADEDKLSWVAWSLASYHNVKQEKRLYDNG